MAAAVRPKVVWLQPDYYNPPSLQSVYQKQYSNEWFSCFNDTSVHPLVNELTASNASNAPDSQAELCEMLSFTDMDLARHLLNQVQSVQAGFNAVNIVYGNQDVITRRLFGRSIDNLNGKINNRGLMYDLLKHITMRLTKSEHMNTGRPVGEQSKLLCNLRLLSFAVDETLPGMPTIIRDELADDEVAASKIELEFDPSSGGLSARPQRLPLHLIQTKSDLEEYWTRLSPIFHKGDNKRGDKSPQQQSHAHNRVYSLTIELIRDVKRPAPGFPPTILRSKISFVFLPRVGSSLLFLQDPSATANPKTNSVLTLLRCLCLVSEVQSYVEGTQERNALEKQLVQTIKSTVLTQLSAEWLLGSSFCSHILALDPRKIDGTIAGQLRILRFAQYLARTWQLWPVPSEVNNREFHNNFRRAVLLAATGSNGIVQTGEPGAAVLAAAGKQEANRQSTESSQWRLKESEERKETVGELPQTMVRLQPEQQQTPLIQRRPTNLSIISHVSTTGSRERARSILEQQSMKDSQLAAMQYEHKQLEDRFAETLRAKMAADEERAALQFLVESLRTELRVLRSNYDSILASPLAISASKDSSLLSLDSVFSHLATAKRSGAAAQTQLDSKSDLLLAVDSNAAANDRAAVTDSPTANAAATAGNKIIVTGKNPPVVGGDVEIERINNSELAVENSLLRRRIQIIDAQLSVQIADTADSQLKQDFLRDLQESNSRYDSLSRFYHQRSNEYLKAVAALTNPGGSLHSAVHGQKVVNRELLAAVAELRQQLDGKLSDILQAYLVQEYLLRKRCELYEMATGRYRNQYFEYKQRYLSLLRILATQYPSSTISVDGGTGGTGTRQLPDYHGQRELADKVVIAVRNALDNLIAEQVRSATTTSTTLQQQSAEAVNRLQLEVERLRNELKMTKARLDALQAIPVSIGGGGIPTIPRSIANELHEAIYAYLTLALKEIELDRAELRVRCSKAERQSAKLEQSLLELTEHKLAQFK